MEAPSQSTVVVHFTINSREYRVMALTGREAINQLYRFSVMIYS